MLYQMFQNNQGLRDVHTHERIPAKNVCPRKFIDDSSVWKRIHGKRVHSSHQILRICDSFKTSAALVCKVLSSSNILYYLRLRRLFCLLRWQKHWNSWRTEVKLGSFIGKRLWGKLAHEKCTHSPLSSLWIIYLALTVLPLILSQQRNNNYVNVKIMPLFKDIPRRSSS